MTEAWDESLALHQEIVVKLFYFFTFSSSKAKK